MLDPIRNLRRSHNTAFAPAAIAWGMKFTAIALFSCVGQKGIPRLHHAAVGSEVANFDAQVIKSMKIKIRL